MRLEFEIISDRIEPIYSGQDARRHRVRMLGLRDIDSDCPFEQPAEFILADQDARRFAHVFRHSSVGRTIVLGVGDVRVMGFGGTVRFSGRVGEVR